MSISPALRRFVRTLAQVGLIIAIWLLATWLSQHLLPSVPPGIAGIAIALGLMALGLLRREWVADGAAWLLREMLLFFVPVVIAVVQYPALFHQHGLAILFVIVVNTLLDTNFMYLRQKPNATTMLDLFGEWPWYILGGELLALVLFFVVMLPFAMPKSRTFDH